MAKLCCCSFDPSWFLYTLSFHTCVVLQTLNWKKLKTICRHIKITHSHEKHTILANVSCSTHQVEVCELLLSFWMSCAAQSGSLLAAWSRAFRKAYRYLMWRVAALSCRHRCLYLSCRYVHSCARRARRESGFSLEELMHTNKTNQSG